MTDTTTSQKIRADITARLRAAEQDMEQKPNLDTQSLVRWLRRKLEFYENGTHREYDRANTAAAQWQPPSMKEQLEDAGFGSQSVM